MDITINGTLVTWPKSSLTVAELLVARELSGKRVAVERNGEIVPRSLHVSTAIVAGDHLEIVVAVGGG
ncbi:MAG: sulfur carrier protein ThiS [Rhodocyclaceae bacterium]|nr:sulfur carrier protein ThiS [Rhodocyclaceae bacterium]MBP6108974.1 sulfur carrier protein ThiS [Rhodocyclaceae bacterium]MBP6280306.1 sulfur carrier protein ThiS [Rhodocyclaceae bacterium]